MKQILRIIAIVAAVFLAGVLLFLFWQEKITEGEKEEAYVNMEKELRPLDLDKRKIRQELDDLSEVYMDESQGMASLVLLFTDMDEIIYTEIFPKMKEHGFIGVLAISKEQFPGQAGCLSKEQFRELIDAGWKYCLKWEKDVVTNEWLATVSKLMREAEVSRPETVYFPQDSYDAQLDNFLTRQGYSVAIHHGEGDLPLILPESGEGLWHPGAYGWNQKGVSTLLSDAISQRGNLVFTVGTDSESEEYLEEDFSMMLKKVNDYCQAGDLMVTDLITAREYRRNLEDGQEGRTLKYQEQKAELEKQLSEIEDEIDSITERYVKKWE